MRLESWVRSTPTMQSASPSKRKVSGLIDPTFVRSRQTRALFQPSHHRRQPRHQTQGSRAALEGHLFGTGNVHRNDMSSLGRPADNITDIRADKKDTCAFECLAFQKPNKTLPVWQIDRRLPFSHRAEQI